MDFSSDDEAPNAAAQATATKSMKSIFESDRRSKLSGDQSLQYDGGKASSEARQAAQAQGTNQVAKQAMASCYKGDTLLGPCAVVLMASTTNQHLFTVVNKERKVLGRIRVDPDMQFIQNASDGHHATLYDASIGAHWTFTFKTAAECTTFVVAALTLHHYMMLGEGPRQNFLELAENIGGTKPRKGDLCTITMKVWLLQKVGSTTAFSTGKDIEEINESAPRTCQLGLGKLMSGVEESLLASTAGTKRLLFLTGKKCKCARSLGNPEIGPQDTVVVILHLLAIEKGEGALPDLGDESFLKPSLGREPSKPKREWSPEPQPQALQIEPRAVAPAPVQAAPAPAPAPAPVPAAAPDPMQQMMQTLLLQQLQKSNEPKPEPTAPPPQDGGQNSIFVERSLDRIHQQLSGLYEKIDRLDVGKSLESNNANIERMVKKAVGKMPIADVDIEDMAKDRDQLLAKIEQLKQRNEELTDKYHKALEQLGEHKSTTAAMKNDLAIQQAASEKTIKELQSRKRLEGVDNEVNFRRQLDRAKEEQFKEGRETGFKDGYNAGKIDAMTIAGSATTEELRNMLSQKEVAIVDYQTKITKMESEHYEERRSHGDQVSSMQSMISRLERREDQRKKDLMDTAAQTGKAMKRIMNSTYSSIEAQIYATGDEKVDTEEVLQLILMTVKQESRQAIDDFKKDAAARASQPLSTYDDDDVPLVIPSKDQPPAPPTETQTAAYLTSAPEVLAGGQPPPPPAAPSTAAGDFQFSTLPPEVLNGTDSAVPPSVVPAYSDPYQGQVAPVPLMSHAARDASPVMDLPPPDLTTGYGSEAPPVSTEPPALSGNLAAFLSGAVNPPPVSNIPTGHTAPLPSSLDWMLKGGDDGAGGAPPIVDSSVPPSVIQHVDPPEVDLSELPPPHVVDPPPIDMSAMVFDSPTAGYDTLDIPAPVVTNGGYRDDLELDDSPRHPEPEVVVAAAAPAAGDSNSSLEVDDDTDEESEEEFARPPPKPRRPAPKPKQRTGQFLTDSEESD